MLDANNKLSPQERQSQKATLQNESGQECKQWKEAVLATLTTQQRQKFESMEGSPFEGLEGGGKVRTVSYRAGEC